MNLPEPGLRRFHHDLRGSVSNLRMALEACLRDPSLLGPLGPEMLLQLGQLQTRLAQQNILSKTLFPQQKLALHRLLQQWHTGGELLLEPRLTETPIEVDPDLLWGAIDEIQRNAERWAQGLQSIELRAVENGWELQLRDRGPGWPEGLEAWLLERDWEWKGQLRLGLRLVKELAHSMNAELRLESHEHGSGVCLFFPGGAR